VNFRLEGRAFPDNPRSSMLTAYSVARTLLNIDAPVPI
jgi:predicted dinucleotide-utilizing enzyme